MSGLNNQPGDTIYCDLWMVTGTQSADVYFYWYDFNNGNAIQIHVPDVQNYNGATDSAEWIVERPEVNGNMFTNLPNYGIEHFTSVEAGSNLNNLSSPNPNNPSTVYCFMFDQNYTHPLSSPSTMDNYGDFTTTWNNYF